MGQIIFYSGTNETGDIMQTIDDSAGQHLRPMKSGDIRSLKLLNQVRRGCLIRLYASPDEDALKGRGTIEIKRASYLDYAVHTFDHLIEDEYIRMSFKLITCSLDI
ncbi:hypothetical protein SAMN05421821_101350 [Mucilaginibacter lappiensis]|uniref:Uncharacterized protein n=1 Tax=Mucilaginibacter lappiensis TaxID=354630 RepID=A0ABR6PD95_9SPHI|nr:hypothetical protein [Mucilaginibacter lappiensis]MBB6107734.1 hypothetical protein [Mucilaginibacter lappiensis]SIP98799.1 hypothetical protein SAMN05421821_101350 [Mucilaginibacter lappiensis]